MLLFLLLLYLASTTVHASAQQLLSVANHHDIIDGNINGITGSISISDTNLTYSLCSPTIDNLATVIHRFQIGDSVHHTCPCGITVVPSPGCVDGFFVLNEAVDVTTTVTVFTNINVVLARFVVNAAHSLVAHPTPPTYTEVIESYFQQEELSPVPVCLPYCLQECELQCILNTTTNCASCEPSDTVIVSVVVGYNNSRQFYPYNQTITPGQIVKWVWMSGVHSVISGTANNVDGLFCSVPPDVDVTPTNCDSSLSLFQAPHSYKHNFTELAFLDVYRAGAARSCNAITEAEERCAPSSS